MWQNIPPQKRDEETQNDFRKRMEDTIRSSWTVAGLSLGTKLGLFKVLADTEEPMTSQDLADKADCKERYVTEWLHHMVMCDIVDVDVTGKMFTLPSHRREALTCSGEAVTAHSSDLSYMLIPHLEILNCFRKDGPTGIPFETLLPAVQQFNEVFSDRPFQLFSDLVQKSIPDITATLELGARVLDVGCGFGNMIFHFASLFPKSTFVGIDISPELVKAAEAEKSAKHIENVEFHVYDAGDLPATWYNTFDCVMIRDVLHDLPYPDKVLTSINKCMKPGGLFSVIEINLSQNPYKSWRNAQQKAIGQYVYITSIYHCLSSSMYHPGSAAMGAGAGIECITELVMGHNFKVVAEPICFGDWNVHILFKK